MPLLSVLWGNVIFLMYSLCPNEMFILLSDRPLKLYLGKPVLLVNLHAFPNHVIVDGQ